MWYGDATGVVGPAIARFTPFGRTATPRRGQAAPGARTKQRDGYGRLEQPLLALQLQNLPNILAYAHAAQVAARIVAYMKVAGVGLPGTNVDPKLGRIPAATLEIIKELSEFAAVIMFGGNIPGKTQVLASYVFTKVEEGELEMAITASAFCIMLSLIIVGILTILNARRAQNAALP